MPLCIGHNPRQSAYRRCPYRANQSENGSLYVPRVRARLWHGVHVPKIQVRSCVDSGSFELTQYGRQRQTMADEDAPPMNSIYDIPTETYTDNNQTRFQPRVSRTASSFAINS